MNMQTAKQPDRRDARLAFRLPLAVADDWRKRADAAGISISDFVRASVDVELATGIAAPAKAPKRRVYTPVDPELLRQLAWIGNNINQLARYVNMSKRDIDAVELLAHLQAISASIKTVAHHAS